MKLLMRYAVGIACVGAALGAARGEVPMLLPGDTTLASLPETDSVVMRLTMVDSAGAEHAFGTSTRTEQPMAGRPASSIAMGYGKYPSYSTRDSMVVIRKGLVPVSETLTLPRVTYHFTYNGTRVTAVKQKRDSAAVTRDLTYPQPVFAFNQMESVVRALPFKEGYTRVLPLFSEIDTNVEYDTISVLGKSRTPGGEDAWRVRFADPVIMMELLIESKTRRVASQTVTYRGRPGKSISVREWPK